MSDLSEISSLFKSSLTQLKEALSFPEDRIHRDSAIKRFELTMDLAWKTVKIYLETNKGKIVNSPKDAFREAYRQGLIDYDKTWLDLVDFRNQSVHEYNEQGAIKIYQEIKIAPSMFERLLTKL